MDLAQYGSAGVAIAALGLVGLVYKLSNKTINNHIEHSTLAIMKSAEAMLQMAASNDRVADALKNNSDTIKDFKEEMRARGGRP